MFVIYYLKQVNDLWFKGEQCDMAVGIPGGGESVSASCQLRVDMLLLRRYTPPHAHHLSPVSSKFVFMQCICKHTEIP